MAQSQARDNIVEEQTRAANMEAERRRQFQAQRQAQIEAALPKFTADAQQNQQAAMADNLKAYLTPQERPSAATEFLPGNPGAPKEIQDGLAGQLDQALKKGQGYAGNLANIQAVGRSNFDNALALGRLGESTGQINQNQQNSAGVLPYELDAANRAGRGMSTVADIANGAGSLLLFKGLTGGAAGMGGGQGLKMPAGGFSPFSSSLGLKMPASSGALRLNAM
jgi:hypothetical protein